VEGQRVPLTVSAGVASFPGLFVRGAAELILFADESLYEAKRLGRNRVLQAAALPVVASGVRR
jgi:GGDEF domain-containing protein